MTIFARTAIVVVSAGLLAACQGPVLKGWNFTKKSAEASAPAPDLAGGRSIERGRALLKAGRISAAVAEFRVARLDADHAAAANNGLGVAYAKLGRMDLAERYLRLAIALDPADDRYAANLIRMRAEGEMLAARAKVREEAGFVAARSEPVHASPSPAEAASRRPGVFHIVTRGDLGNAPRMTVASREEKALAEREPTVAAKSGEPVESTTVATLTRDLPAPFEVFFRR